MTGKKFCICKLDNKWHLTFLAWYLYSHIIPFITNCKEKSDCHSLAAILSQVKIYFLRFKKVGTLDLACPFPADASSTLSAGNSRATESPCFVVKRSNFCETEEVADCKIVLGTFCSQQVPQGSSFFCIAVQKGVHFHLNEIECVPIAISSFSWLWDCFDFCILFPL